jgi:hypothetical protein
VVAVGAAGASSRTCTRVMSASKRPAFAAAFRTPGGEQAALTSDGVAGCRIEAKGAAPPAFASHLLPGEGSSETLL